jgi:phosphatidylglycerol lysyltransferase
MRQLPDAPSQTMDFLFISLMLHGHAQGYRWLNLGMAPMSGMEDRELAPVWHRLGALVFRHGEYFYNFRGLRAYKEKFGPVWRPMYLAAPGGLALPRVLANIAALVSRGLKGVIAK